MCQHTIHILPGEYILCGLYDNKNNGNRVATKKKLPKNLFKTGRIFLSAYVCVLCPSVLFLHQKYLYLAFIVAIVAPSHTDE